MWSSYPESFAGLEIHQFVPLGFGIYLWGKHVSCQAKWCLIVRKTNKQKTTKRISSHFLWVVLHHWTTWAFLLKSVLSFIARLDVTLQPYWLFKYWDVFILFGKWLLAWASHVPTTTMLAPPTSPPELSDLPTSSSKRTDSFPNPVTRVHYSCLMAMLVSLTKTGFTSTARFLAGSGLLPSQSSSVEWATPREKFHYPLPCNLPLSGQWLSHTLLYPSVLVVQRRPRYQQRTWSPL